MEMVKGTVEDIERGDHERKGTVWTATAHIVTAVIGSGVLALAWSTAQLGWIAGPIALIGFAGVTYFTSSLLADCYRSPHPVTGERNHTYVEAVKSYLGPRQVVMCGIAQYLNIWGAMVGYTVTASTSIIAVKKSNCFHEHGHEASCASSGIVSIVAFGSVQILLSQLPGLDNLAWLSIVAAVMSFAYSGIGLGLCIAKWISHGEFRGGLQGAAGLSPTVKTRNILLALGNIAFAYTFSEVLIEIQNTLKSPPSENKTMKKAALYGIGLTTVFYFSLGFTGYAAFGEDAPGNILTGFGFYEPFWLIDVANICIVVHLIGAYQVFAQPIFAAMEKRIDSQWPESKCIHTVYTLRFTAFPVSFTMSKLIFRSVFVVITTTVAMLLPFFNAILGLVGALAFWPLTVYFPVNMHMAQERIKKGTTRWTMLQCLSFFSLLISLAVAVGSIADIVSSLKGAKLFKTLG